MQNQTQSALWNVDRKAPLAQSLEAKLLKEMVLSGQFLTQHDQIDTWIATKLSDTSMQLAPEFLAKDIDIWSTWAAFGYDEDGEEFAGEDGNDPRNYWFNDPAKGGAQHMLSKNPTKFKGGNSPAIAKKRIV